MTALIALAAIAFDLLFGEFPTPLHPVVWMGKATRLCERVAPRRGRTAQLLFGAAIVLFVPAVFAGGAALALQSIRGWRWAHLLASVLLLKSTFALRALGQAARRVRDALEAGEIDRARMGLRALCSRDASNLKPSQLVAATVESVAENTSDSFIAPLGYFVLFGVPGAIAYRAVNTLDAMIGYHGHYEYLGKAAARLDDALNLIPARLTAALLLLGGTLAGGDFRGGWLTWRRDGRRTESPNAGRPMAAMAGLLRVELAKAGHYRLGDAIEPLTSAKIERAWRMSSIAAVLGAAIFLFGAGVLHGRH
jgi:adenosylcobinamide-phosphate synthase